MQLGVRLVLLILFAALPIFSIDVIHELQLRDSHREEIVERSRILAERVASRENRFVEAARFLLIAISRLEGVRKRDPVSCSRELHEIGTQFPEITGIGAFTPEGDSFCSSGGPAGPLSIADRPYFQDMLRSHTMKSSGYIVGRRTGRGSFVFVYPTLNDDGSVQFVGLLALSTDALSQDLSGQPLPAGAFVALLDHDGVVIARWPNPDDWMGKKLSNVAWAQLALKARSGSTRATFDGARSEYALGYAPMERGTEITVVVGQPISPELRRADLQFWQQLGLMSLVFLLTGAAAWLGARRSVQQPIRALSEHVDDLARGKLDATPVPLKGGLPELRSLGHHFQQMAHALATRQAQLIESLQQKELLLKEVNHRVKNSLQLVASLFGLQRSRIADPQVRRHFEEAMQRVSTVARVHQLLYKEPHIDSVRFDEFLAEICEELNKALGSEGRAVLECRASECRLPTDQAIPLALIANELVTNAFKYAYPDRVPGMIRVECRPEQSTLVLTVSDYGIALPPGFDPATSEGLGMRVIMALVKQLRGRITIESRQSGKAFVICVPTGGGSDA